MHKTVQNLINIKNQISDNLNNLNINNQIKIIAVSKTFKLDKILPLIEHGHVDYGENKVQEAEKKWAELKKSVNNLKLHMIGRLQTNKAKKVVELFDYVHSLDSEKLANELSKREKEKGKKLNYFIQINLGSEEQKGGVEINNLEKFYDHCVNNLGLTVLGLMAIPPNDKNPEKYFKIISELSNKFNFSHLSIGMSSDYLIAIKYKATFVRIGSAIFGSRN